jgi:3-oxoacyl-[acyl-carrier-protein] synthase-1
MEKSEEFYKDFFNNKHTEYISMHDAGASTDMIADYFNGFDLTTTISTACSSALNSIIFGANLIKTAKTQIALVGGTESLSKFHLNGFNTLMILDKNICKPFDRDRNGLNLGEGAAYLVLETEVSAKERGVEPICYLSGYANTCDAFHQTASSPNGQGAYLAMIKALEEASLQPHDISYINAHGTATENNDLTESIAIKRVFGENIPPFSSTKALSGHTTSAAGSVESVISILALINDFIPKSYNFFNPIEELAIEPQRESINRPLHNVMTNSFGFGGNDTTCIFSKLS